MRATRERLVEAARRSAIHLGGQADLGILMSPEARSAVERAGGADGRNELVTFQRLFLCLSSSSSFLCCCISSALEAIHPSIENRQRRRRPRPPSMRVCTSFADRRRRNL